MIKCVASVVLILSLLSCGKKSNAKAQNKCEEVPTEGVIAWDSNGNVTYYKPGEFRRGTEEGSYVSLLERDMVPEMIAREELKKTLVPPVTDPTDYKQWCSMKNPPEDIRKTIEKIIEHAEFKATKKYIPFDEISTSCEASYEFLMNEKWISVEYGIKTVWPLVPFKNVKKVFVTENILRDLTPLILLPNLNDIHAYYNRVTPNGARYPLTCPPGIKNCTVDRPLKPQTDVQAKAQVEEKK